MGQILRARSKIHPQSRLSYRRRAAEIRLVTAKADRASLDQRQSHIRAGGLRQPRPALMLNVGAPLGPLHESRSRSSPARNRWAARIAYTSCRFRTDRADSSRSYFEVQNARHVGAAEGTPEKWASRPPLSEDRPVSPARQRLSGAISADLGTTHYPAAHGVVKGAEGQGPEGRAR
jgi:hypothetical protein